MPAFSASLLSNFNSAGVNRIASKADFRSLAFFKGLPIFVFRLAIKLTLLFVIQYVKRFFVFLSTFLNRPTDTSRLDQSSLAVSRRALPGYKPVKPLFIL